MKSWRDTGGRCFDAVVRGISETSAPVSIRYFEREGLFLRYKWLITMAKSLSGLSDDCSSFRLEGTGFPALGRMFLEMPVVPTMFVNSRFPAA
ncbi:hypothetical protein TNCT_280921 [Trichonephila clavata]|uniref:Uncharacterized protein n=1 Tax=Trichonephila clavata TaxID=2740835 RepID=A0A8X6HS04_TRICU|nr:hypothetical protein TNCT_280921 [Trichonephila clavata]